MAARDTYRQASLGGINLVYVSASDTFGRRGEVHEYPEQNEPYSEDLGRRAREFNFTGAILGEDHAAQSQRLIDLIERGGVLTFVHPLYGSHEVICFSAQVTNDRNRQRETVFNLTLVEAGEFRFPSADNRTGQRTSTQFPGYATVARAITLPTPNVSDELFGYVRNFANLARIAYSAYIDWNETTTDIDDALEQMQSNPGGNLGSTFTTVTSTALEGFFANGTTDQGSLQGLTGFIESGSDASGDTALYALQTRLVATGLAAAAGIRNGYTNPVEALAFMQCLITRLETDAQIAADNCFYEMYSQILEMIGNISIDYRGIALGLPPIISRIVCGSLPSLVAAYEVHGNVDDVLDVEQINGVRSCFFMPTSVQFQPQ